MKSCKELERALTDWLAASREVYQPGCDASREEREQIAWEQVESILVSSRAPTAA